jgi:hypothetical protein
MGHENPALIPIARATSRFLAVSLHRASFDMKGMSPCFCLLHSRSNTLTAQIISLSGCQKVSMMSPFSKIVRRSYIWHNENDATPSEISRYLVFMPLSTFCIECQNHVVALQYFRYPSCVSQVQTVTPLEISPDILMLSFPGGRPSSTSTTIPHYLALAQFQSLRRYC